MKKFVLLFVAGLAGGMLFAQQPQTQNKDKKVIVADNVSYTRQQQLLDSVIARHLHKETPQPTPAVTATSVVSTPKKEVSAPKTEKTEIFETITEHGDIPTEYGDIPADDIYAGDWGTKGVNDFRRSLDSVPDSVYFDLKSYVQPVREANVTSRFGPRRRRYHYGVDLRVAVGEPVTSAFEGKVRITSFDRYGYGNYVVVRHPNGLETVYGHLSSIKVFEGENVVAGQCIGLGGSTGRSTGPHLHFETRFLGNPINPEKLFSFETGKAKKDKYFMTKAVAFSHVREAEVLKAKAAAARYHKVRSGDSLSRIASRYGTTVQRLCQLNRINKKSTLRIGQTIRYN